MSHEKFGIPDKIPQKVQSSIAPLPKPRVQDRIVHHSCHRRFHAVRKYGLLGDNRLHYGRVPFLHKYDRAVFLALIIDEYTLRLNLQEQERIQRRIDSLIGIEPDDSEEEEWLGGPDEPRGDCDEQMPLLHDSLQSLDSTQRKKTRVSARQKNGNLQVTNPHEKGIRILQRKLRDAQRQLTQFSRNLYEAETMLPETVRRICDAIREDPKWYMRKALIKDCAGRGGCCGRDCGCCALRALGSYEKGIGHCTVECVCCVASRGFRPNADEKRDTLNGLTMLLRCDVPTHFLKMVNAFFSKSD